MLNHKPLSKIPSGYQQPSKWAYPIDLSVDYREPQNRGYLLKAWVEALSVTEEHNQQMRLMDYWIERDFHDDENYIEMKIWLSFLWGCCYNSIGPWTIINEFKTPPQTETEMQRFRDWYNVNFERMRFDTDCRYRKSKMIACVESYVAWLEGGKQWDKFQIILEMAHSEEIRFETLWNTSMSWKYYGRLSAWNFIECLNLVFGDKYKIDIPTFMLEDRSGSESNRNGAAFLSNREDLLTKHGKLKINGCNISDEDCQLLEEGLEQAFQECQEEFKDITYINRLNFETSGACWLKKMFRERNTRYIGWDAERTYEEIRYMEENWPEYSCQPLWEARALWLPDHLLCEKAPEGHPRGVQKGKMPVFFLTGKPLHIWHLQQNTRWLQTESKPTPKETVKAKSVNIQNLFKQK